MPTFYRVGTAARMTGSSAARVASSPASYALMFTNRAPTVPVGSFSPFGRVTIGKDFEAVPSDLLFMDCKSSACFDVLMLRCWWPTLD